MCMLGFQARGQCGTVKKMRLRSCEIGLRRGEQDEVNERTHESTNAPRSPWTSKCSSQTIQCPCWRGCPQGGREPLKSTHVGRSGLMSDDDCYSDDRIQIELTLHIHTIPTTADHNTVDDDNNFLPQLPHAVPRLPLSDRAHQISLRLPAMH